MPTDNSSPRKPWPEDPLELIPLAELPDYLERRRGKQLHRTAIYRWRMPGIHRQRLKCKLRGSNWWTCRQWLQNFEDAITQEAEQLDGLYYAPAGSGTLPTKGPKSEESGC